MKILVGLLSLAFFCSTRGAQAAVVESDSLNPTSETAFPASATDLIDQSQATFGSQTNSGFTNGFSSGGPTKLNDGTLGTGGNNLSETTISLTDWTTTFHLNTSTNTLGYDLSSINTITGWPDNRVNQKYDVYYSTVASNPTQADTASLFTLIKSVDYEPDPSGPTNTASTTGGNTTEVALAISGISGVNAVQFRLSEGTPGDESGNLETVWREFDAFGSPTLAAAAVPEPSSVMALGGLGAMALARLVCRRRQAACSA